MGVYRLQTFLQTDVPNEYCWKVDVKKLADEYRKETGRQPMLIADGNNCIRQECLNFNKGDEWMLGGQMQEFIEGVKNFVAAFQNIGVKVVFFFDGAKRRMSDVFIERENRRIREVIKIFKNLDSKTEVTPNLPAMIGAVGHYVIKYACCCDVQIALSECDAELADFAQRESCFAILSNDTDFVILQGARHFLFAEGLDLTTMTTLAYSREGLLKFLGLNSQQLFMLASLLGNDIIPFSKLKYFHRKFPQAQHICELLPYVVDCIKEWGFDKYGEEELHKISKDVFQNEGMADDLSTSIRSYLPFSTGAEEKSVVDDIQDEHWQQILRVARGKHQSCQMVPSLYNVIAWKNYKMSSSLEDYSGRHIVPVAKIYRPLRQRLYGVLFYDKPTVTAVNEWCVESREPSTEMTEVPVVRSCNIERFHVGLLKLWNSKCKHNIRLCLFAETLTQGKQLDANALEKLGFPYIVPVAVLFYLMNEYKDLITEADVDVILAQAALLKYYSLEDLKAIKCQPIEREVIQLSTLFNRGVTTVLFLLSACGFEIEEVMPWLCFDGKLFQQKYIQKKKIKRVTQEQLCDDKKGAWCTFITMKRLVLPTSPWR